LLSVGRRRDLQPEIALYFPHPSPALHKAFETRPFQGAAPEDASYIFLGLDANYAEDVEQSSIWPDLLEYLADGVRFWRERRVHHPFVLPAYRGDGRKYHKTFSRIGFRPEQAHEVCFIELVHVPTFGRSALNINDLNRIHLKRIRRAIEGRGARNVFVPDKVGKLMHASGEFPWMPNAPADRGEALRLWRQLGETRIYWHYHFSVYGPFEARKAEQLEAIAKLCAQRAR
jgi:hypothetical protein